MAKVRGPLHSMEASGLVDGLVYARNPYGQYCRDAPGAAGAPSAEQTQWRNAMTYVMGQWETNPGITADVRAAWVDFARAWPVKDRWGRQVNLDAARWFVRLNIARRRKGLGLHLGPPIHASCKYFPDLTITQQPWGIQASPTILPTGDQLVQISRVDPHSITRNFCPRETEFVGLFGAADTPPWCLWENGDLDAAEKRYFFVYKSIDGSGRPSCKQMQFVDCSRWTAVHNLTSIGDVGIRGDNPTTKYGGVGWCVCTYRPTWERRPLVIADFSGIPAWAKVLACRLYWWSRGVSANCNATNHQLWVDWVEMEADWMQRKNGANWGVPGGQSGVDYNGTNEDTQCVLAAETPYSWDCAVMAQEWIDGTRPNYGTFLIPTAAGAPSWSVYSREEGVPTKRPYYSLTFGT